MLNAPLTLAYCRELERHVLTNAKFAARLRHHLFRAGKRKRVCRMQRLSFSLKDLEESRTEGSVASVKLVEIEAGLTYHTISDCARI